ncbi:MAG: hypothetical protein IPM25_00295 [Chloracidobacterium sp.]|nr:hypothetical protein [Chloracidobacterium sp.]
MFEQESFDNVTSRTVSQSGDLFNNYEIRNWDFSPRLYKILAFSAIFNMAALVFVAQTNLLTLKGCDSPWVGRVCQVLDMAYVGAMLYGTERDYVDVAYERIELGEADITFIDVTGETPPLSYPEGYFQIANPVQYEMLKQMAENPNASAFTTTTPNIAPVQNDYSDLLKQRAEPPPPNPNAFQDDLATANPPVTRTIPSQRKGRGGRVGTPSNGDANTNTITTPDKDTVADANTNTAPPTVPATDKIEDVTINRKPMTDFADAVLVKWSENKVDFSKPFTVELNGFIQRDGTLDPVRSKWDPAKELGDPAIVEIAKQSIESVSAAGWFGYLRNLDVERFKLTMVQNEDEIIAIVSSEQITPERARTVSSGMRGLITGAKLVARDESDEKALLEHATSTSDGRNFVLNFKIPKPLALEMIDRNLKAAMARKQSQPQPNGAAPPKPDSNTAIR